MTTKADVDKAMQQLETACINAYAPAWESINQEIYPAKVVTPHAPNIVVFSSSSRVGLYRFGTGGKLYLTLLPHINITWEKIALVFQQAYLTVDCPPILTGIEKRNEEAAKAALGFRYVDGYSYYMLLCKHG